MIVIIGFILFLWFFLPILFKGLLNTGSVLGTIFSIFLVLYGIFRQSVSIWIKQIWTKQSGRIALCLMGIVVFTGTVLTLAAATVIIRADSAEIPKDTPAIVLGCSVKGKRPSRILQERIDAAAAYLQKNPNAICILSGGKGSGEDISEAECMYRELVKAGIKPDRLYKEADSTNTRENLENSKQLLQQLGYTKDLTIISSEFHLYRGRRWAAELGFTAYGYAAHTDWRYFPSFFLREIVAVDYLWLSK